MANQDALGLMLLQDGIITQAQLHEAMGRQRVTHQPLVACLAQLGLASEAALLAAQAKLLDLPALSSAALLAAAPAALSRVPAAMAMRLRIVPYSWDGEVLGVAVGEGETLEQLTEVAEHTQAAIGAYVALPADIEAALVQLYPPDPTGVRVTTAKVIQGLPPMAVRLPEMVRVSFYDATAQIYEAKTVDSVGQCIGGALLNYFTRVLVFRVDGATLRLCASAGGSPARQILPLSELPELRAVSQKGPFYYGRTAAEPAASLIPTTLGMLASPNALLAFVGPTQAPALFVYADNGPADDLYDDMHHIELLLRDAAGALGMLTG